MLRSMNMTRALGILVVFLLLCTAAPLLARAESTTDLSATIRAEILSDPRTSGLSQTQIDGLVSLLTDEAQKQGITSQDIQWRPQSTERFVAAENIPPEGVACMGGFLCIMSEAFGFIGSDATIPFSLGAASMGLIWILAEMIHRRRHPAQVIPPPQAAPQVIQPPTPTPSL